jgi:hypothetical protein
VKQDPKLQRPTPFARAILATGLLLGLLLGSVPFAVVTSAASCKLACCAGRAPHAAGSCMNGSCHVSLNGGTQQRHIHSEAAIEPGEHLCGLSRIKLHAARLPVTESVTIDAASSLLDKGPPGSTTDQTSISTTVLTKPCQADCGSCGSSFTNLNRQRNSGALAYADRPRPPSGVRLSKVDFKPTRKLSALCRRGAPRGPPSFS